MLTEDWKDEDFETLANIAESCSTPDGPCDPEHLLGVMWVEGRGARADAKNPHSSATGLIQWMGSKGADGVVRYFGRSRDAFCELGVRGQLPFIRAWFLPHRGHLTRSGAVYTAVFLPAFVKMAQDPQFVLCAENSDRKNLRDAYLWNKYFDQNKDGKIQVLELERAIEKELAVGGARCKELFERLRAATGPRPPRAYTPNVQPAAGER